MAVSVMGSIVATEKCLFRTTVLRRQTGMPWGEGVARVLATHTGRLFVLVCSRMHGCEMRGHTELFCVCTHANTSNSLAGRILTVSTKETMSGEVGGCDRGGGREINGCCETGRVCRLMSRTHQLVCRKSRPRIASAVNPSAMINVVVNGIFER